MAADESGKVKSSKPAVVTIEQMATTLAKQHKLDLAETRWFVMMSPFGNFIAGLSACSSAPAAVGHDSRRRPCQRDAA